MGPGLAHPRPAGPGLAHPGPVSAALTGSWRTGPELAGSGLAGSGPAGSGPVSTARGTRRPRLPGLVILADTQRRELPAALVSRAVPHLAAAASEAIGVVGPLVLPGRSACLRCLDLIRAEHDPAWPLILAQLATRPTADPMACDTVLATTVAAQAAAQVLAFLDHGAAAAVTNGTLELVLPGWQWRRRTWQPHPDCGCRLRG